MFLNFQKNNLLKCSVIVGLLATLSFLFFYKLGTSALQSYDEAWYADIARNLTVSKNPLHLQFNFQTFQDHPPLGFILMAAPMAIFGSNEFSARFISSLMGIGVLVLVFLIGKSLKNTQVGIMASLILLSSMWFMLRARSGNLDVPFLFWQTITVWALLRKDSKFFYLVFCSFACLLLTKTLVGLGLLPLIIYCFYKFYPTQGWLRYAKGFLITILFVLPWYLYNQYIAPDFLNHHFLQIGMRSESNQYTVAALANNLNYLSYGIGRWFKPFLLSLPIAFVSYIKQKSQRTNWIILLIWWMGFAIFLFSKETDIWHLLPLYPVLALTIGLALSNVVELVFKNKSFLNLGLITVLVVASLQFYQFSNLLYPKSISVSSEKEISVMASAYSKIYLMETFYPAAVYYSQQKVVPLMWQKDAYQKMIKILETNSEAVFVVNKKLLNDLTLDKVDFVVMGDSEDYYLIKNSN